MPDSFKYLVRKMSGDIHQLYLLLQDAVLHVRPDIDNKYKKEIDERLNRISKNAELLYTIDQDIEWDNRTNRKFQKLNALLLITPTVIGLIILVGGVTHISATRGAAVKVTQEIALKDSVIKEFAKVMTGLPDSAKSKLKLIDSIKKLNQTISDLRFPKSISTTYFKYDILRKPDTIDLKAFKADLLFLNNTDSQLTLSVISPPNIKIQDFLFRSVDPGNSFDGPNGQIAKGQFLIISVAKLKQINQNITLQSVVPSIRRRPPYQQLTLKIK